MGHFSKTKKMVNTKIKLGLPFMAPDLVYEFSNYLLMWKLNTRRTDIRTWVKLIAS